MSGSAELSGSKYLLFLVVDFTGLSDSVVLDLTLLTSACEVDNLAEARRFRAAPGACGDAGSGRDDRRGIVKLELPLVCCNALQVLGVYRSVLLVLRFVFASPPKAFALEMQ